MTPERARAARPSVPVVWTEAIRPERVRDALQVTVYRDEHREITAVQALDALTAAGIRWYAAGGTVRDWVRGDRPRDLDFVIDQEVSTGQDALRRAFPGIDPSYRPRPHGFVLQWGAGAENRLDLAMIRSYRDVGDDVFATRFRPRSDLRENALVIDFTFNSLCWDPESETVIDPLGTGVDDARDAVLRVATHPRILPKIPQTTLRIVEFLCRGYEPAASTLDHLRRRADLDVAAMEARLPRWFATHLLLGPVPVEEYRSRLAGWLRSSENLRRLDRGLDEARKRFRGVR